MFTITRIRPLCAAAVVALGVSVAPVAAPPAQAALGDVVCTPPSSNTVSYTPALTNSPQNVTVTINYQFSSCVSTTSPAITSGTALTSAPSPNRSCLNLAGSNFTTITITWNTGQTSTIAVNSLVTIVGGVFTVTLTGSVISGLFAGDTVLAQHVGAASDILLCTAGLGTVSSIHSMTTLTFV